MKLARVSEEGAFLLVVEDGGAWYRLDRLLGGGPATMTVQDLLKRWEDLGTGLTEVLKSARGLGRADDAVIREPGAFELPLRPGKIVALGRNYAAHAEELGNEVPEEPLFFGKSPTACIGPGSAIELKSWHGRVDYEGELAVVIGKRAKDIPAEAAREHIAGYTLLNDVTAREMQQADKERGHPWFRCKNLDTFCPLGPVIVTRDALPWPLEAALRVTVNGELRQEGHTGQFIFTIPETLAYISRYMTLEPGDVVSTGTPEGVGPLADGDWVDVTVDGIGTLGNPVKTVS